MADDRLAEYIIKLTADVEGAKKFDKATKELEKDLKGLGVITDKTSTLLGFKLVPSFMKGKVEAGKLAISVRDVKGNIHNLSTTTDTLSKKVTESTHTITKMNKATLGLGGELAKLTKRAALVIPVWLLLRGAMMAVFDTIRDGAKYWVDLTSSLGKAEAVTRTTTMSIADAMNNLRGVAEEFGLQHKGTAKDVTEAYYRMATSGLAFSDAIAGAVPATKLAIGTYGDITQTGKTVAAIYRLMGNNIEGAVTQQEKMTRITDVLAKAWSTHEVELNEISQAMANAGAQASSFGLSMEELISLIAVSSDSLIKSGRAGRLFSIAMSDIAKNLDKVEKVLGTTFDPSKPVEWFDVLMDLIKHFKELGDTSPQIEEKLTSIFGRRSVRLFRVFVNQFGSLNKTLDTLKNKSVGAADALLEIRDNLPETQLENFRENITKLVADFISGATDSIDFVESLKKINTQLENMSIFATATGAAIGQLLRNLSALPLVLSALEDRTSIPKISLDILDLVSRLTGGVTPFKEAFPELKEMFSFEEVIDVIENNMKPVGDTIDKALEHLRARLEEGRKKIEEERKSLDDGLKGKDGAGKPTAISFEVDIKRSLKAVEDTLAINEAIARGATNTVVTYQKILNIVRQIAEKNDVDLKQLGEMNVLSDIRARNWEKLVQNLKLGTKEQKELVNLAKLVNDLEKERLQNLSKIRESFAGGLSDVIMGDIDFKEFGDKLSETISRAYADAFGQAITSEFFDLTGFGDIFAEMGVNISNIFGGQAGKITSAHADGAEIVYNKIVQAHQDGVSGVGLVAEKNKSSLFGLDIENTKFGKSLKSISDFLKAPRELEGKFGNLFGKGSIASRGMGAMQLADLYKLKGTGNVFGGGVQGATAGAQLGGPVGAVLGGLYGMFRGGQSKTTSETRTQTKQVASRIDVTNKKLDVVNRNLISLKTTLTYILPQSAYFSEKANIESEFSLSSRR